MIDYRKILLGKKVFHCRSFFNMFNEGMYIWCMSMCVSLGLVDQIDIYCCMIWTYLLTMSCKSMMSIFNFFLFFTLLGKNSIRCHYFMYLWNKEMLRRPDLDFLSGSEKGRLNRIQNTNVGVTQLKDPPYTRCHCQPIWCQLTPAWYSQHTWNWPSSSIRQSWHWCCFTYIKLADVWWVPLGPSQHGFLPGNQLICPILLSVQLNVLHSGPHYKLFDELENLKFDDHSFR
jgi:hypothetical protein